MSTIDNSCKTDLSQSIITPSFRILTTSLSILACLLILCRSRCSHILCCIRRKRSFNSRNYRRAFIRYLVLQLILFWNQIFILILLKSITQKKWISRLFSGYCTILWDFVSQHFISSPSTYLKIWTILLIDIQFAKSRLIWRIGAGFPFIFSRFW